MSVSLSTSPLPAGTPGRPRSAVVLPTTTSPSPSKAPAGRHRPASLRQPLGVISVQAKSFQDRHRTEFAHLHTHSNDSLREKRLEAEKAELENARRVGKEKRESLKAAADAAAAAAAGRGGGRSGPGRRPLSLVVKQSTASATSGGLRTPEPTTNSASFGSGNGRPISAPPAGTAGLNAVIESSLSSAHLADDASPADTSISQSSYSWASQFSGETEELRTAARYVPKPRVHSDEQEELNSEEEDEEQEEILASPEDGTIRRRKKIVALAHTVRQLEGVGSREAEDPAFYATLVKAWNERPMVGGVVPPSASSAEGGESSPYTPQTRYSDSAATSNAGADGSSTHSRSVRYSYASTLHDLAVEGGGIEQANRIFLAKPWLRASIISTAGAGTGTGTGESKKPVADFFGAGASQRPPAPAPPAVGEARRLSLASSPPPLANATGGLLGSPIDLDHTDKHAHAHAHALRKVKGDVSSTAQGGAAAEHEDEHQAAQPQQQDAETSAPVTAPGNWGLGFVSDWFAGSAPVAEHAEISLTMPRSTTVAQFDDAPNDDSLLAADADEDEDEDAEGESDPEYELAHEHLHEQGFHEGEDGASTGHPQPPPPPLLHVEVGPELPHPLGTDAENEARPESSILPPSPLAEDTKNLELVGNEINKHSSSSPTRPQKTAAAAAATADPDLSLTTTEAEESITGSPSSNPSQPLICSTHSITSYQPRLVRLPSQLGLDPHPPVLVEELELLSSSGHSHEEDCSALSDSFSSPLTKTITSTSTSTQRASRTKPTLAPIQTATATAQTSPQKKDKKSSDPRDIPLPSPDLDEQLCDPRFSNAYLLAQSIRVPTPSIRPATVRHSSANALNVLLSPTSRATSPLPSPGLLSPTSRTTSLSAYSPALPPPLSTPPTVEEMEISSRWLSQDSSEDAMTFMMGGGDTSTAAKPYQPARTSPTNSTRPLAPAYGQTRARSSTMSLTTSPVQLSPMGPPPPTVSTDRGTMTAPLRKPSRPTLLDTRAPTLNSISELGSAMGSALHPSDTLNSISGGSELLSDVEDGPISPRLGAMSPDMTTRRSRLAQSSLDSLPSQMRPPSISDSFASSSLGGGGRRGSNYQMYQQRQIERSRRANARVAAKMSGATAKELKQMEHEQHNPHLKGESGSVMVTPEPSRTACTLFFLGFVLGPWFWIFGGWMPLGHSGEIKRQNQQDEEAACSLDFTGADHLPRGWRWTYHPDPWVKRNRRAAAIVIPILLVGGIAAAVAVAVVFGAA